MRSKDANRNVKITDGLSGKNKCLAGLRKKTTLIVFGYAVIGTLALVLGLKRKEESN